MHVYQLESLVKHRMSKGHDDHDSRIDAVIRGREGSNTLRSLLVKG